jgi:hypothetical protein
MKAVHGSAFLKDRRAYIESFILDNDIRVTIIFDRPE